MFKKERNVVSDHIERASCKMNVRMLCHFDQREKSRVSKDEISRYARNDTAGSFSFFTSASSFSVS